MSTLEQNHCRNYWSFCHMKLTLIETYVTFPDVETNLKVLMMFITYDYKYITKYIFSINLVNLKCKKKMLLTKLEVT